MKMVVKCRGGDSKVDLLTAFVIYDLFGRYDFTLLILKFGANTDSNVVYLVACIMLW